MSYNASQSIPKARYPMSKMYAMVLPVLPGKLEDWKQYSQSLLRERRREYEAARIKAGIQRELIWHQATPLGDMLILLIELDGTLENFLASMANPQDDFSRDFLAQAKIFHGLDPENVKGAGINQLVFEWNSPTLLDKANETFQSIGQNLAGTAQDLMGKATSSANDVGANVAGNAAHLAGKAQELATEAGKRIEQQANEVRRTVESKAGELLEKAGENVVQATQQMQVKAGEVIETAAGVGQEIAEKASDMLHQALDKIAKKPDDKSDSSSRPDAPKA